VLCRSNPEGRENAKSSCNCFETLKRLAMLALFWAGFSLALYVAHGIFGIPEATIWLVILGVGLLVGFIFLSTKIEALEQKRIGKDYEGIIKEINDGQRREPKHDRPTSLNPHGWKSFVNPAIEILYEDFDWFGAVLDRQVGG
jgi:hypothetical protein